MVLLALLENRYGSRRSCLHLIPIVTESLSGLRRALLRLDLAVLALS